jgi:hypothetical protein
MREWKDIYTCRHLFIHNRDVWFSTHAIKQAVAKKIDYPDRVFSAVCSGKMRRFGKNHVKFIKKSEKGSIICVGIDTGQAIVIKTIEKGN